VHAVLWYLLAALVAVGSLAVLGVTGFGTYRTARGLFRDLGSSGERVATASSGLTDGLAELQTRAPASPASRPATPHGADGAALARRVQGARGR